MYFYPNQWSIIEIDFLCLNHRPMKTRIHVSFVRNPVKRGKLAPTSTHSQLPTSLTMQPKKQFITKSKIQSSSSIASYLSCSSSSSGSLPTSSLIDLTSSPSSPSPPTTSASTSQRAGGKTSYIWNHGKKIVHEGKDRWECSHCGRSYAIIGLEQMRKYRMNWSDI